MNGTKGEIQDFLENFLKLYEEKKYLVTTCFAFPGVFLNFAQDILQGWKNKNHGAQKYPIYLMAQHVSCHKNGPHTGQISASMLKDIGCDFALLGHPECPWEDSTYIHHGARHLLDHDIFPVVCLGNIDQHLHRIPQGDHLQEHGSLKNSMDNPSKKFFAYLAYEPCVGAKEPAKTLAEDSAFLRQKFPDYPLLYGGGISPENLAPLCGFFDGFLVGRASLSLETFFPLLEILWAHHESS